MQTSTALWLLVVPALALAGCSDAGGGTDTTPGEIPADFEDLGLTASTTTGILRGVVIDDRIVPIEGVQITAVGSAARNWTMETKADGLFGFDGLEPGDYFVTASKEGFLSVQTATTVVAGDADPDPVKIQLVGDPAMAPYILPFQMVGYITCSVRPMFMAQQCGVTSNDVVHAEYELPRAPQWLQVEMTWTSTQAVGDELSLSIRCLPGDTRDPAEKCPEGQRTIVRSEGKSPQIGLINETHAATWALGGEGGNPLIIDLFAFGRTDMDVWDEETIDGATGTATGDPCTYWVAYFPPQTCMRATGPGVIVNQQVDVYTHAFFGFTPNDGWQFGRDGEHPAPASE